MLPKKAPRNKRLGKWQATKLCTGTHGFYICKQLNRKEINCKNKSYSQFLLTKIKYLVKQLNKTSERLIQIKI